MNINKDGLKKVINLNKHGLSDGNNTDDLMSSLTYYKTAPFKIALFYIIAASIWIIFSDILAEILSHKLLNITIIQTYKGWIFVIVTAYMLYMLVNKYMKQNLQCMDELIYKHKQLESVCKELSIKENELQEKYIELKKHEDALRISEERYKSIVEGTSDAIWEWNFASKKLYLSDRVEEILGYKINGGLEIDEVWDTIIHHEDRARVERDMKNYMEGKTLYYEAEFRIKPNFGEYRWVLCRGKVISGSDGKPVKLVGSVADIQERRKMEEQLMHMAYYDILTELPNRSLFMQRLENELAASKKGKKGSVLFIDIDDFQKVNNVLGHDYGDQLLKLIAETMKISLSDDDMICRFGGDEFIVLHPGIENDADGTKLADRILGIFENPFEIGNKEIYVTASIGIGIYPDDGAETEIILKNAGAAANRAKEAGKNRYYIYDRQIFSKMMIKNEIDKRLRTAVKNEELYLYYQPQVNSRTGRVESIEALLRWYTPELGVVSPADFIPVAEESGLIVSIGDWVAKTVCLQNKIWKDNGYDYKYIALNISPVQFQHCRFLDMIMEALRTAGLSPEFLEIEITENMLMKSYEENIALLKKMRDMGIRIALDDFGTGYSSMNYLRQLPINTLKIDKSFINNVCTDYREAAVVEGIISLAHKMDLDVVAEGVEKEEQYMLLREKQCDRIQGYYFSRPLPVTEIEEIFKKGCI